MTFSGSRRDLLDVIFDVGVWICGAIAFAGITTLAILFAVGAAREFGVDSGAYPMIAGLTIAAMFIVTSPLRGRL